MNDNTEPVRWLEAMPDDLSPVFERGIRAYPVIAPTDAQRARIWSEVSAAVARPQRAEVSRPDRGWVMLRSVAGLAILAATISYFLDRPAEVPVVRKLPRVEVRVAQLQPWAAAVESAQSDQLAATPQLAAQTEPRPKPQPQRATPRNQRRQPVSPAGPAVGPMKTLDANSELEAVRTSDASAELALLTRARRSLWFAPDRALELTREHQAKYPQGMFEQEREVIAIDALLRASRPREARVRARRFILGHPHSAHVERLDEIVRDEVR